jgi:hypothetical protein
MDDLLSPSAKDFHRALLDLVREGRVFAVNEIRDGSLCFIHAKYATDEHREFTRTWLQNPYFQIH